MEKQPASSRQHRAVARRRLASVRVPILLYAHPFEMAIGFVLFLSGIRSFVSGESSPSINDALPQGPLLAFQMVSFFAGAFIVTGLLLRRRPFGRTLERAGCLLAAGAYAGYAAILGATIPLNLAWSTLSVVLAIALAFWLRAKAIRKTELTILRALRAANAAEDDASELIRRLVDSRAIDDGRGAR